MGTLVYGFAVYTNTLIYKALPMKIQNILLLAVAVLLSACSATLPVIKNAPNCQVKSLSTPGPEDFALDIQHDRLVIAAVERRAKMSLGDLYAMSLTNNSVRLLPRSNEPENFLFRPHGVDIALRNNQPHLFVVLHGPGKGPYEWSKIAEYQLMPDAASYVTSYSSDLMYSPNDVEATDDGYIYASNDPMTHVFQALFGMNKRSIVAKNSKWFDAAEGFVFPNGMIVHDGRMYVADTMEHVIWQLKPTQNGRWGYPKKYAKIKGPDNLYISGNYLYTAGHIDSMAFLKHARNNEKLSPSVVFRVPLGHDVTKGPAAAEIVYVNDGSELSAASGALEHKGKLYIANVFQPKVLVCELP